MTERAFSFIKIPERSSKPRTRGLTLARDLGVGYSEAEAYMEAVGEYIDYIKIRHLFVMLMGEGSNDLVRRKIDLYKRHDIDVNPGGIVYEMAFTDGVVEQTFDKLAALGFTAVECSENIIPLTLAQKKQHIQRAKQAGLKVMFEVGEKYPTEHLDVDAVVSDMKELLGVGCDLLILEKSVIEQCLGTAGEKPERETLIQIAERVGLDKIVFEAEASPHQVWLFRQFGPDVNLGPNLDFPVIAKLEPTRRTLSREGGYDYVIDKAKALKVA